MHSYCVSFSHLLQGKIYFHTETKYPFYCKRVSTKFNLNIKSFYTTQLLVCFEQAIFLNLEMKSDGTALNKYDKKPRDFKMKYKQVTVFINLVGEMLIPKIFFLCLSFRNVVFVGYFKRELPVTSGSSSFRFPIHIYIKGISNPDLNAFILQSIEQR